eukprot:FR739117.1.p1 GENE.FR739117.1~~FR739117.1.p1  ORF type:complete len:279 (+),score=23.86 FR739117.1:108-839(+)
MGISTPRGVVLHGPPGTGKTALAHAIAFEARNHARFFNVRCTDVIRALVGESERTIAKLFATARQAAPSIILLDQIEVLAASRRVAGSSEHTLDRVLSALLVEMDGLTSSPAAAASPNHVLVVATAADLTAIDAAMLRPGRLDQHILVALPDHDARVQILRRLLRNTPLVFDQGTNDSDNPQHVQRSELCDWLAAESAGFSGAELSELCRNASLIGLRENLAIVGLERRHMAQALAQRRTKPS